VKFGDDFGLYAIMIATCYVSLNKRFKIRNHTGVQRLMNSVTLWYSLPEWLDDRKKLFTHDGIMLSFSQAASECFSKRKMLKNSENDSIHECFGANNTTNIKVRKINQLPVNKSLTLNVGIPRGY
jgi:hypothetical protein